MFFGREFEFKELDALWSKRTASLITLRGRRRIGKSTLVEEFARRSGALFIKIDGKPPAPDMTNRKQLEFFIEQLQGGVPEFKVPASKRPKTWFEAFTLLDQAIGAAASKRKTVVLLDEISWMGAGDKGFPGSLKTAWDNSLKKRSRLILFLCGSVSSWITQNILNNTGFVGRRSRDFVLGELPPHDCAKFWGRAIERISPREILDVLSVTGGVPRYLEEVNPALSADENIRRLCFMPNGPLVRDFEETFAAVFGTDAAEKRMLLGYLAEGPKTVSEIATLRGGERNGHLADNLRELVLAGFLAEEKGINPETGKSALRIRYRLRDNYSRFYLHYIQPSLDIIQNGAFINISFNRMEGWDSVMGLQFENLVLNNWQLLLPRLGLENVLITSAAPYAKRGGKNSKGCQIDLLIQARRTVCAVEIKRKTNIGREVENEMAEKLERLTVGKGVSIRTALVYEGELSPIVEGDGYFDTIIKFSDLLIV